MSSGYIHLYSLMLLRSVSKEGVCVCVCEEECSACYGLAVVNDGIRPTSDKLTLETPWIQSSLLQNTDIAEQPK